jgi:hypothetical protein
MLLYALFSETTPFESIQPKPPATKLSRQDVLAEIPRLDATLSLQRLEIEIGANLCTLIRSCLRVDPSQRPTIAEVANSLE